MSSTTPPPANHSWITITLAVFGGLALVGVGGTAAVAASGDLSRTDSVQRVDVDGVTAIEFDGSASDVRVQFGDVDEAELTVRGGRGGAWTFERDDDELIVRSPAVFWGWWLGRWFDDDRTVVLTLPERLEGIDASFILSAGGLDVDGAFGELDIEVSAGELTVEGSSSELDVDLSAGGADLLLDGVSEAELSVSAGDLTVELTGTAPRAIAIDVSAGGADVTLPDAEYAIVQDVSAGTFDNRMGNAAGSDRIIDVTLSAGTVTLRSGR
ncbi:DUF4097 family beta strand repeat-containing protein [Microbacterium sp.]|uniref:DUF4097 family beta strand repeat-containing protein n=1 Tax=Microbacterium sp. TaxID=51671 RepID=UPI0039E385DB